MLNLRLPPVDEYRAPFVQPIGHLAMQAAHAEDELVTMCACIPKNRAPGQMTRDAAAHRLRNWPDAIQFIHERVSLIAEPGVRANAEDAVARYIALRDRRHRAIHDAVSIGIFGKGDDYQVVPLGIEYRRNDRQSTTMLQYRITPELLADLACQMYDVQKDLNAVTYFLNNGVEAE
jgi:hypothetical protein